ncbi:diguanylate cyclase [Actinoplanes sp. NBRC 101535]|uniref:putative bifunctional diguanylate cyclase/phosphodiesterase n=1 Tax=Actinoplanes sp. NBRC 101535 TaxID=3032196 RepID=UPI0024A20581|nr:diguanylate cyclase [Actinoplanes sp. NBRC 101535]GLY07666.1 hypothetical protein Acsp01_80450 [Actinoplanes sp. NBRC 101535]
MAGRVMLAAQYLVYALALAGIAAAAGTGAAPVEAAAGPGMFWFDIVAVVYGWRACRHPGLDPPIRRVARTLLAAFVITFGISLTFTITGTGAFPQPGDVPHLLVMAVLFVALLLVPMRAASRRDRLKTLLDAGTVVLGASMVLWYVALGPALESGKRSVALLLAAACYPVADLLVLFALARALLCGDGRIGRRVLTCIGLASLTLFVSDAYLGYAQSHMTTVHRSTFEFVCWLTTHLMLCCGAIELWRQTVHPVTVSDTFRRGVAGKLPYLAVAVGVSLTAVAAWREHEVFPWLGLVVGSTGLTGVVMLRQVLAQSETAEAAETDALTGLANRARLREELTRALQRSARTGRPVAVLLIDLNGFKQINDTLGHLAGDGLLAAVAEAMQASVRQDDLVGRLGGDEFGILLQSVADEAGAAAIAERIIEAIAGPFVIGSVPMSASASIGVAVSAPGELDPDTVLHRADVAMYDRKRQGSGWQAWQPDLESGGTDTLGTELGRAAAAGQLRLSYHPIRTLDGAEVGASTALSWEHPEIGTIAPEVFLPIAERTGVAGQITDWTLRRAIADAATWDDGYVTVAVTPQQSRHPRFTADVSEALAACGLPGHRLVLTMTGDALNETSIARLRELGVRLAVRDLGRTFEALHGLSVNVLDLGRARGEREVVEALIRLGQALGLSTLVGGVEVPPDATDLSGLPSPATPVTR